MRRLHLAFAIALLAPHAHAEPVKLSEEIPVGKAILGNTSYSRLVDVASNGRDFLALWSDIRGRTTFDLFASLYAGRVDAGGHPLYPTGHKVAEQAVGRLAWTGSSYLLVYNVRTGPLAGRSFAQALDDDGNAIGPPSPMNLADSPAAAASNGRNVLVVHAPGEVRVMAFDGALIWSQKFPWPIDVSPVALQPNGNYVFVTTEFDCTISTPCKDQVAANIVDSRGGLMTRVPLMTLKSYAGVRAAMSDDGNLLVTWIDDTFGNASANYELVSLHGDVIAPPVRLGVTPLTHTIQLFPPAVAWDGSEFLVAVPSDPQLMTFRISAAGQLLNPAGVPWPGQYSPLFAKSATGVLAGRDFSADSVRFDPVVRAAGNFAQLGGAEDRVLAQAANDQAAPHLASGAVPFAVWREGLALSSAPLPMFAQPLGGSPSPMAAAGAEPVAVARGSTCYLVAWADESTTLRVQRRAFDGTAIDSEPIIVTEQRDRASDAISAAFDGTNFLVAWGAPMASIRGLRLSQKGVILDKEPIKIADAGVANTTSRGLRVVWSGSAWVAAWLDVIADGTSPAQLFRARVSADGQLLGAPAVIWNSGRASNLALASSGGNIGVLWISESGTLHDCLSSMTMAADGTPNAAVHTIACADGIERSPMFSCRLAWSGSEFVAVWADLDAEVIRAQRLDRDMLRIDAAPFAVSPAGAEATGPDIVPAAGGVAISYLRLAFGPPYGDVQRGFVRYLDRLGAAPRRRAAN